MGDEARARRLAAIARKWLEDPASGTPAISATPAASEELSSLVMAGARVSLAERGRVVCSLRVRAALTVRVCPQPLHAPAPPSIRALI